MNIVYAMDNSFVDLPSGQRMPVPKGSHWPASDPAVQARPWLFSTDARWGLFYTEEPDGYDAPIDDSSTVEAATAAPGEKRSARRS